MPSGRRDRIPHVLTFVDGRIALCPAPGEHVEDIEANTATLSQDGWSMTAQPRWPRSAGGVPLSFVSERALLQVDLRRMTSRRLAWVPAPGGALSIDYSASPDGTHAAVAEISTTPGVRDPGPLTLLLVPIEDGEVRQLVVLPPSGLMGHSDDRYLQWSPDGRLLALSHRENGAFASTTVILDVAAGEVVRRLTNSRLMGSLSFSDDSRRLLVGDVAWRPCILDLSTGLVTPVAWLPDSKPDPGPRPTACGFIGNRHLLTTRQRTGTVTVSAVHLDSGEETPLLRWAGGRDNAPNYGTFSRNWLPLLADVV